MTKLTCHVTTCANYEKDCCCLPDIQVSGPCACGCEQTCCSSFAEKGHAQASNSVCHDCANPQLHIGCNVGTCAYNQGGECSADCVCIEGNGACVQNQTECSTFRSK